MSNNVVALSDFRKKKQEKERMKQPMSTESYFFYVGDIKVNVGGKFFRDLLERIENNDDVYRKAIVNRISNDVHRQLDFPEEIISELIKQDIQPSINNLVDDMLKNKNLEIYFEEANPFRMSMGLAMAVGLAVYFSDFEVRSMLDNSVIHTFSELNDLQQALDSYRV